MDEFWNWLVNTLNSVFTWIGEALLWIINAFLGFVEFILNGFNWLLIALGDVLEWFIAGINIILTALGSVITIIWQMIEMSYQFVLSVIENALELVDLVALALQALGVLVGLIWQWIGQAISAFFYIVRSLSDAQPTQIPYLPRCVTAPMESEICAVWYMTDYTIFAGEPGTYLVPLIVLIIDIAIVLYVVRSIFKLIRSFEATTESVA